MIKLSHEIRKDFINYFKNKNHKAYPSYPLVPASDPTLMFTNSGMIQFKDIFLGTQKSIDKNITTCQKCVRAGGKHNDLENVGFTTRHHTFFEMLGNFSFGDYFKEQAILMAWEYLTKNLGLDTSRLYLTHHTSDQEARSLLKKITGLSDEKIISINNDDNFWSMGSVGPCGPCAEIFYDHGPHVQGGPPNTPEQDGDRFTEIWNIVFMEYSRAEDGTLTPLENKCIDTGMGLERIAAVQQGTHDNFQTDIFLNIIQASQKISSCENNITSHKIIADHLRSAAFLIADGVIPSNEGRGYVLRRIIRRAARHISHHLQYSNNLLSQLLPVLSQAMSTDYPELISANKLINNTLDHEEQMFKETMQRGANILSEEIPKINGNIIPGDIAFKMHDTYGLPLDLTIDIAKEYNKTVDEEGFIKCMNEQKTRSQKGSMYAGAKNDLGDKIYQDLPTTKYEEDAHSITAQITHIITDGQIVSSVNANQDAILIFDKTPLYAEGGGQVGDSAIVEKDNNIAANIHNTKKVKNDKGFIHIHYCKTNAQLSVGDKITVSTDKETKNNIRRNHSATHLLHAALKKVLGPQVIQKGSLVNADKLRFDFNHNTSLTTQEIQDIENAVNHQIRENNQVLCSMKTEQEAKDEGAMALFGEKYEEIVRVITMGSFSKELCGGSHVQHTGDIGAFVITGESSIASGIRRIEAKTGKAAITLMQQYRADLIQIKESAGVKTTATVDETISHIEKNIESLKQLKKQHEQLIKESVVSQLSNTPAHTIPNTNIKLITYHSKHSNTKVISDAALEHIQNAEQSIFVILSPSASADLLSIVLAISADINKTITLQSILKKLNAKGGGKANIAQGSIPKSSGKTEQIITAVTEIAQQAST